MNDVSVSELLRTRLSEALQPSLLDVIDESHLHAGHAGASGGAKHFALQIASRQFAGKNRVAQQRLVYAAVSDLMPHPIHALRFESIESE